MVIGARIRNEGGSLIQIDSSFECLCLKAGGISISVPSYTFPGTGGATVGKTFVSEGGCAEPIIALLCSNGAVGVLSKVQSGNSYTWEIVTSVPGATVTYWVFDNTSVSAMAFNINKGLRIKNPNNGSVIFDSRYKYMRIVKLIDNDVVSGVVTESAGIASGFAVAISESGLYFQIVGGYVGGPPNWRIQRVAGVAGVICNPDGTITSRMIGLSSSTEDGSGTPPPTGTGGSGRLKGLVLDMRNY